MVGEWCTVIQGHVIDSEAWAWGCTVIRGGVMRCETWACTGIHERVMNWDERLVYDVLGYTGLGCIYMNGRGMYCDT